ncbi:MAG: hypothetical protein RJA70_2900 [Pseudomonadota bacterium]|jgi:DNA-binding response OmpR family regulator
MSAILVVEDNPELAENLSEILVSQGHEVHSVASAEAALEFLASRRVSGVLTDLRLPGKSGLDLLRELRANQDPTPLILMTAFADSSATRHAQELGALDVMLKPFRMSELFPLIAELESSAPSVLVVDDNREFAENLADALRTRGFEPQVIASVEEALCLRTLPKVALVDLRLPDGSGLQVAQRLGAQNPEIAVILITGYPEDLADQASADRPVCVRGSYAKPVPMSDVLERVAAELMVRTRT